MNSNREILAAVLVKWAEPLIGALASSKLSSIPFLSNIEAKTRATGWVTAEWSIGAEIAPFIGGVASAVAQPLLNQYLSGVPDDAIPAMAHSVVDTALKKGELSLLEGSIVFDKEDLNGLKRLLNANLPSPKVKPIKLKEDETC